MSEAKYQYFCTKCGTERDSLLDHPAIGIGGYSWNCPRCNGPVDSREVVMSEAPKKIWYDSDLARLVNERGLENDIPYIRADIVDELVEALEHIEEYWNRDSNISAMSDALWHIIEVAQAALAKLEESHD